VSNSSIAIFVIGTLAVILFTWLFAIKAKRPHGIPRFFSFECILLLAILNVPVWFVEPLAWNQVISWLFLLASIIFAVWGFILLRMIGKPKGDFENTTRLVETGLYRFIRHPLYSSLLFLGTGTFFKDISILTAVLAFVNLIALIATAKTEEKEMIEKFGEEYINYMKKTKMFVPYLFCFYCSK
jgi:protein-S-isoprenylcysteine O-methyltransferase Ste14